MSFGNGSDRPVGFIRDQIKTSLACRSGTWLASFAELVAMAVDSGVPIGQLQDRVISLLGPAADGEVHEDEAREALIDALAGRWASIRPDDPGRGA